MFLRQGTLKLPITASLNTKQLYVDTARLINDGTIAGNVSAEFATAGAITGSGTFSGQLELEPSGTFSPGDGLGSATAGSMIIGGGSTWIMEIDDAAAPPGVGMDYLHVLNTVVLQSFAPFTIDLVTLNGDVAGPAVNFDPSKLYHWTLVTGDGGISGFGGSTFVIELPWPAS